MAIELFIYTGFFIGLVYGYSCLMGDPIEKILAELPDPYRECRPFIDLDDHVPHLIRLRADESWVEIPNDAKDEFEIDGTAEVFTAWRVEREAPLDIIAASMHARAGRLALDARRKMMIGSLNTNLILSELSERRAGGIEISIQNLGYCLESTVYSFRTPIPSLQWPMASTQSEIQIPRRKRTTGSQRQPAPSRIFRWLVQSMDTRRGLRIQWTTIRGTST